MKTIEDLLDAAKAVTGSDIKTGKALDVLQPTVAGWRRGKSRPNDKHRAMLAEITGWSYEEVVAAVNANDDPEFWGNFVKRLGGIAAAVLVCVTSIMTPTPSEAAPLLHSIHHETVYYVKLRRRLKQLALGLVEQITRFRILVPQIS
jgi:hypothetical protein